MLINEETNQPTEFVVCDDYDDENIQRDQEIRNDIQGFDEDQSTQNQSTSTNYNTTSPQPATGPITQNVVYTAVDGNPMSCE